MIHLSQRLTGLFLCIVVVFVTGVSADERLSPGPTAEVPPELKPGTPTLLGITGLSVNGQVHSHGIPTTWYVKYGPTSAFGRKTAQKTGPPTARRPLSGKQKGTQLISRGEAKGDAVRRDKSGLG